MATEKQIAANRANAKRSTGPKTEEGKRASSQNAVDHALLAQIITLKTERENGFVELLQTFLDELDPQSGLEQAYVENMAVARWRQTRVWALQTCTLHRTTLAFQALADQGNTMKLLLRYEAANDRLYNRSLNMLLKLRALKQEKPSASGHEPGRSEPAAVPPPPDTKIPNKPNLPSKPPASEQGTTGRSARKPIRTRSSAHLSAFRRIATARGLLRDPRRRARAQSFARLSLAICCS